MSETNEYVVPYNSSTAGSGFVVTGVIIACIGLFVIVVELFNYADMGPMMFGSSAIVFGLLLMVVGYVKKAAIAAEESYRLQARIYEEQRDLKASGA